LLKLKRSLERAKISSVFYAVVFFQKKASICSELSPVLLLP